MTRQAPCRGVCGPESGLGPARPGGAAWQCHGACDSEARHGWVTGQGLRLGPELSATVRATVSHGLPVSAQAAARRACPGPASRTATGRDGPGRDRHGPLRPRPGVPVTVTAGDSRAGPPAAESRPESDSVRPPLRHRRGTVRPARPCLRARPGAGQGRGTEPPPECWSVLATYRVGPDLRLVRPEPADCLKFERDRNLGTVPRYLPF